jgi:3-dehydroquinate dehydratase-1/3-dehydroquinate dehydratase/shikimate dehydrogenase
LFTNRADWEGGFFCGTEEARLSILHEAIDRKAAYIDIEVKTEDALKLPLIAKAKDQGCTSIASWHSFTSTPSAPALKAILQEQYRSGAQIGKIVTMAQNFHDVLRVLDLQNQASELGFPLIAFCMGSYGIVSRIATLNLGGFMTYASTDEAKETAPGQLPASTVRKILEEINCGN